MIEFTAQRKLNILYNRYFCWVILTSLNFNDLYTKNRTTGSTLKLLRRLPTLIDNRTDFCTDNCTP